MQCVGARCQHYTPMDSKWSCSRLQGKLSLCNKCGDQFVLDRRALLLAKPICSECVVSAKKTKVKQAVKFIGEENKEAKVETIVGIADLLGIKLEELE